MQKRYCDRVENVDFEKLRKCLKDHGIKKSELSKACGYYPDYIEKNVLRKHVLNTHVRDVLAYAYKVDPIEYTDIQPKEVAKTEGDDMYKKPVTFAFRIDPDIADIVRRYAFLKRMKVKDVMEEIIVKQLGNMELPEREEVGENIK